MPENKISNLDQLQSLTGGSSQLIKKFIDAFLQTAPQKLKELEQNIKEKNTTGIKAVAHASKAQFAYMGMQEIKAKFERIEHLAVESKLGEIEKIYSEIVAQAHQGISELENVLKNLS